MALSDDQRALIRLLLAGDTYEQVADVLGSSPAEVRTRAHDAAAELERAPEPELPSQAVSDRIAALEGETASTPPAAEPEVATRLAALARRWGLWIVGGIAVLVVLIVIAVTGSGGGGGDDGGGTSSSGGQEDAVPIRLSPVGGAKANGTVTIIRIGDQPALDLDIRALTPSPSGRTYVLWFVGAGGRSLPVAFRAVGPDGVLSGRTAIPSAAAGLLPSFETAELTLAPQRAAAAAVQQAARSGTLPQPVGTTVMRGALRG